MQWQRDNVRKGTPRRHRHLSPPQLPRHSRAARIHKINLLVCRWKPAPHPSYANPSSSRGQQQSTLCSFQPRDGVRARVLNTSPILGNRDSSSFQSECHKSTADPFLFFRLNRSFSNGYASMSMGTLSPKGRVFHL
jgi:hypothetical protein